MFLKEKKIQCWKDVNSSSVHWEINCKHNYKNQRFYFWTKKAEFKVSSENKIRKDSQENSEKKKKRVRGKNKSRPAKILKYIKKPQTKNLV